MAKAPAHLSPAAKKHWSRITREYELTSDGALTLQTALENWDLSQTARELMAAEGIVVKGRRHPAQEIAKSANILFLRALRELGLAMEGPGPMGRPPAGF
jgi:phage terminase small subunit